MPKDTTIQTKQQATEWKNIFTSYTADGGLVAKIYKELKNNLDNKKTNNQIMYLNENQP